MMRHSCLTAVVLACLLGGTPGQGDDGAASSGNYSGSLALNVDRDATEALSAAENDLSLGQNAAALARLQELLDRSSDVLVQRGSSSVSLWEAVNQRLAGLASEESNAYQRIVQGPSEAAFAAARNPLDPAALTRLTDRYRHTPVGRRSAILLAALAWDRGDALEAAAWGEFLRRHYPATAPPAGFTHWHQPQRDEAETVPSTTVPAGSWSLDLGVAEIARHAIDAAVAELNAQALTPILTCRPLVVDQRIITRTVTGVLCVDTASGEPLWTHPIPSHAARLAVGPGTLSDPIRNGQIAAVLLRRLVRNSLEDELATDGESVFALMTPDRSVQGDPQWPANILRSIDVETGQTRWELVPPSPSAGGRRTRQQRAAARAARYFLGPPLIDGDRLLFPAQHGENVELVALRRQTGELLWSVGIGRAVRDLFARQRSAIEDPQPEDRERQSTSCRLTRSGPFVLFPTGAGAIACVDVMRQRLVWVSRYPRRDLSAPAPTAGDETHFREMPTRDAFVTAGSWIVGNVGVCLAPDADLLLAFDLFSGRLLWSRPRGDAIQVIPAGDLLLVVGPAGVTAVGIDDGVQAWMTFTRRTVGRAVIQRDRLIIPLSGDGFEFLDTREGTLIAPQATRIGDGVVSVSMHPPQSLPPLTLRNLHRQADIILSQSATSLQRVAPGTAADPQRSPREERLESLLSPVADWRADADSLVAFLRHVDSRVSVVDGLLVRLLEQAGLQRSREEQVQTLLTRLRRAQDDEDADSAESLRRQLIALDAGRLYVTVQDGLHSCRLDRWVGLPAEEDSETSAGDTREQASAAGQRIASVWPSTTPRVSEHPTSLGLSYLQRVPIDSPQPDVWSDVTVEVDRQGRMIQLHSAAHAEPTVFLLPRETGTFRLEPRFLQGWVRGRVLLVRIGTELVAFERGLEGELPASTLWPANGQTMSLLGPRSPLPTSVRQRPDEAAPPWDTTTSGIEDVFGRGVGDVGPVRADYFCYRQRGAIVALHTSSGQELWRRTRWPVGTRCVGDDESVVVFHPERPEVTVLDAVDGRTVRIWNLKDRQLRAPVTSQAPFAPQQISGTRALLVRPADDGLHLQVLDLRRGATLWDMQTPEGTIDFPVDEFRFGLVIPAADPEVCSVRLFNWQTGELTGEFDVNAPPDLQTVHTFCGGTQRYLILSGRITDLPLQNVAQIRGGLQRPLVNGTLHAFDEAATRLLWSRPLENMAFPLVQPRHVPLLVMNDMAQPAGTQTPQGRLVCLDARTGETLTQLQQPMHVYYTLQAHPDAARIDIRLQGRTLRLDYHEPPSSEGR